MVKEVIYTLPPNGDQDHGPGFLAACWVFAMAALISTIVRILVRSRLTRNLGWDDYWMILTEITTLVGLGFVTKEVIDGLGRHMYYLTEKHRKDFTIVGWLDWMQAFITICFCKISICMFLLRIKSTRQNAYFMYTLIALNVIVTIVCVGMFIGICSPPDAYWIIGKEGRCLPHKRVMAIVIAQGIFSSMTDIILATTPYFFLKDLQISRRTKIALCVLMGAGYLTAACAIVRTALSGQVLETDATYAMVPNAAWRATEVNLGILCANAPILRPLYLWSRGRLQKKSKSTSYVATRSSREQKSSVRLWSKRHAKLIHGGSQDTSGSQKLQGAMDRSGYTDTSAELGLPIEGYLMNEMKNEGGNEWMEEERGRLAAQEWTPPPAVARKENH
ncbi:MAG: hypothetical protein Q9191_001515 [Dirinaria sp. TL-2023a]